MSTHFVSQMIMWKWRLENGLRETLKFGEHQTQIQQNVPFF